MFLVINRYNTKESSARDYDIGLKWLCFRKADHE